MLHAITSPIVDNRRSTSSSSAIAWISKSKSSTQLWRILDLGSCILEVLEVSMQPPWKRGRHVGGRCLAELQLPPLLAFHFSIAMPLIWQPASNRHHSSFSKSAVSHPHWDPDHKVSWIAKHTCVEILLARRAGNSGKELKWKHFELVYLGNSKISRRKHFN